jgi:hypothetical protein
MPAMASRKMGSRTMHKTQAFKTCDGRLFDNEAEAARHEATIKIQKWAERRKISTAPSITWEEVSKVMIDDADELAYLFITLARALPRNGGPALLDDILPMNNGKETMWLYKQAESARA